ncbi:MAG: TonB family protein [Bryobacteraceae bacterium]
MSLWNESVGYSLLLGLALKSTAVLGAAWIITFLLRRRSAAARHLVWTAACAALLALPVLSLSLPSVRVPVPRTLLPPGVVFQTAAATPAAALASGTSRRLRATAVKAAGSSLDWRPSLIVLWAAGTIAVFAQMLLGWAGLWRFHRNAHALVVPELASLAGALGIRHSVELLESPRGSMPMTFGLLRPAVFLPADAAQWSAERREVVLLHELAHVRRGDIATHLLARTALSLNWWNPLAWIAWRELLKERERAADDLVLSAGACASGYADHLLAIARTMQLPAVIGSAAIAMARRSQLEGRLLAILDSRVNRTSPGRAFTLVATLLAVGIVAPVAALRGQESSVQALPADVDATIRAATAQQNHQMLDSAADAAESARKYDIARRLLDASLAIRLARPDGHGEEYGMGLLKLADLERKRGKAGQPRAFYSQAISVLGEQPEAAAAWVYLGIYAMPKNLDQAMDYFEHAKRVNPKDAGPATMWMAVVRQRQSNAAEAESLYRAALALEDASSPEAATTMELFADFLRQQDREEEAKEMQERALTLRKAQGMRARSGGRGDTPNVSRIGGGVTSPKLMSKVEPEYTDEARAAKYQGQAVLSVEVGTDGLAHNIQIVRGLGLGLDDKAIEALTQWRFQPGTKDGQPVTVIANIEINWRLM